MNRLVVIYRTLLLAVFALWFGGFTFYTAFVVPIGTEVLGSSRAQGMVTQQVTDQLNAVGGFMIAFFLVDFLLGWKSRSRRLSIWIGSLTGTIAVLWIGLLWLHSILDGMIIDEDLISDEVNFYQLHRAYLWTSTVQWILCWGWLVVIVSDWFRPRRHQQ